MLQEHVRTTKTDKTRFFLARKQWNWYPTNNYSLMSNFNQPNIEWKNCVWTTKHERLSEMCFLQYVEMKSVFKFQPIKPLITTTVKMQSLLQRFENFFQGPKTDKYVVWRGWCTLFCKEDESRLRKRKTISIFEEISWTKKG